MSLPNKTIYLKDSDLRIWDRAQKELKSVSSLFVDYLQERLATDAIRKRTKKIDEVQAMKELLAETNAALNLDIELHPFWNYPILDQSTLDHGYKLHQRRANPDRIMSLVVWPLDVAHAGHLSATRAARIKTEIQKFWDGKTTEMHKFVDTTKERPK